METLPCTISFGFNRSDPSFISIDNIPAYKIEYEIRQIIDSKYSKCRAFYSICPPLGSDRYSEHSKAIKIFFIVENTAYIITYEMKGKPKPDDLLTVEQIDEQQYNKYLPIFQTMIKSFKVSR